MLNIAAQFSRGMAETIAFIDLLDAAVALGRQDPKRLRSKHAISTHGLEVHRKARSLSAALSGNDGAFLVICALFEMTVRELVEKYVSLASGKKANFNDLPAEIKEWHPRGCAHVLANLDRDQFQHLTQSAIVTSLYGCLNSPANPYQLMPEAYSYNERNFKSEMVSSLFKSRLGVKEVWKGLATDATFRAALGAASAATAERLAVEKLNTAMNRRNAIVHRGRHYYTASNTEVRETAGYFDALVSGVARVLTSHLATW